MRTTIIIALLLLVSATAFSQFATETKWITITLTRDSVSAAYAANDAVSDDRTSPTLLVFSLGRQNGIGGLIIAATANFDTNNTANATFDLLLYSDSAGVTAPADTASFILTTARATKLFRTITFSLKAYAAGTGCAFDDQGELTIPFQPIASSTNIYGQLVAKAAYQPKLAGVITIKIGYIQE